MATRKPPSKKATVSSPPPETIEADVHYAEAGAQSRCEATADATANVPAEPAVSEAAALVSPPSEQEEDERQPRFHFFIIDAGWKSAAARVIRENFHMIREFQNNDPLYILNREQSVDLIRANPELIGKDPIILVHDLHAQGGRGESGYHGFRLCLGLIKNSQQALNAMQEFLRFVQNHRQSADIEKDIRKKLHRQGLEGAIDVIREGAQDLME